MNLTKDCKDEDLPYGNLIVQELGYNIHLEGWIPNISATKLSLLRGQDFFKSLLNGDHCVDMRDHIILRGSEQLVRDHWFQMTKYLMEIVEVHVDTKELFRGIFSPRLEWINNSIRTLLPIQVEKCSHHIAGKDCLLLVHHNSISHRRAFDSIFCDLLQLKIQFLV